MLELGVTPFAGVDVNQADSDRIGVVVDPIDPPHKGGAVVGVGHGDDVTVLVDVGGAHRGPWFLQPASGAQPR